VVVNPQGRRNRCGGTRARTHRAGRPGRLRGGSAVRGARSARGVPCRAAGARVQVDAALTNKLPDVLTERQKRTKVSTALRSLVLRGLIEDRGSRRHPRWLPAEGPRV